MSQVPAWAEAYCFDCECQSLITAIKGMRRAPMNKHRAFYVAVGLACGHERQGADRVVMSGENLLLNKQRIGQPFLTDHEARETAGALMPT